MTWTRLDDGWCDRDDVSELSLSARWHLLALVQWCSRTHRYDGLVRAADARRCSDVDHPDEAVAELAAGGHLEVLPDATVRVIRIEDHVPPPHLRDDHRKRSQRERKARQRDRPRDIPGEVPSDVPRDTGTGQDGPGQDYSATTKRSERAHCSRCDRSTYDLRDGMCIGCASDLSSGRRVA